MTNTEINSVPGSQPGDSSIRQKTYEEEIAECIANSESPDPRKRSAAIRRLCQMGQGIPQIIAAMSDLNSFVRTEAAASIGFILKEATPEVEELLLECMEDANGFVRSAAILSVGNLKVTAALPLVRQALEDENKHVVSRAIKALGRMGDQEMLEPLRAFLEDPNIYLVGAAVEALGLLEDRSSAGKIMEIFDRMATYPQKNSIEVSKACLAALSRINDDQAVPFLVRVATTQVGMRTVAIDALSAMNVEPYIQDLLPLLLDSGESVRTHMVSLIVDKKILAALPMVHEMFKSFNANVRQSGVLAVYWLKDESGRSLLYEVCLADKTPHLRALAVEKYIQLFGASGIEDLLCLASDPNPEVRRRLVEGIWNSQIVTPSGLAAVQKMALDEIPEVADMAKLILEAFPQPNTAPVPVQMCGPDCLFPARLASQAPALHSLLVEWRKELPRLFSIERRERLDEINRALEALIREIPKE